MAKTTTTRYVMSDPEDWGTIPTSTSLAKRLDEAHAEIKRLEDIITKHGGWGFTPYEVRKGLR